MIPLNAEERGWDAICCVRSKCPLTFYAVLATFSICGLVCPKSSVMSHLYQNLKYNCLKQRSAAVGLRKPNLIRWDSYLDECLHAILVPLGSPLNARASDKVLCQFVGLKRKADEFGQKSSKDEFGVMGISDIDTKTQDFSRESIQRD